MEAKICLMALTMCVIDRIRTYWVYAKLSFSATQMLIISHLISILEPTSPQIYQKITFFNGLLCLLDNSLEYILFQDAEKCCCLPSEAFERFRFTAAQFSTPFVLIIRTVRCPPSPRGVHLGAS